MKGEAVVARGEAVAARARADSEALGMVADVGALGTVEGEEKLACRHQP